MFLKQKFAFRAISFLCCCCCCWFLCVTMPWHLFFLLHTSDMWRWRLYWKRCRQTTMQFKGIGVPSWTVWKTWTSPSKGTLISNMLVFSRNSSARDGLLTLCAPLQTCDGAEFRPGQRKQHPWDDEGAAIFPGLVRSGVQSRLRVWGLPGRWEVRLLEDLYCWNCTAGTLQSRAKIIGTLWEPIQICTLHK